MEFKAKFNITNQSSLKYIKEVIHAMNCNLCRYSDEKFKLIELGLDTQAQHSPALTTINSDGDTTVFYDDRKSSTIQKFALCHEIGHIVLEHKYSNISSCQQEKEADLFAELLLSPQEKDKKLQWIEKTIWIIVSILILIAIALIIILSTIPKTEPQPVAQDSVKEDSVVQQISQNITAPTSETVYFTQYGEVYHKTKDCHYLKYSKKIYSDSIEECGKDRPCSACW